MADLKDVAVLISALFGAGGLATAIATVIGARASAHKEHAEARAIDNEADTEKALTNQEIISKASAVAASVYQALIDEQRELIDELSDNGKKLRKDHDALAANLTATNSRLESTNAKLDKVIKERDSAKEQLARCQELFDEKFTVANKHIEELTGKIAQLENEKAASEQRECELLARMERDKAAQARREAELIARIDELSRAIERFKVDRDRDVNELLRQIKERDDRIAKLSGGL